MSSKKPIQSTFTHTFVAFNQHQFIIQLNRSLWNKLSLTFIFILFFTLFDFNGVLNKLASAFTLWGCMALFEFDKQQILIIKTKKEQTHEEGKLNSFSSLKIHRFIVCEIESAVSFVSSMNYNFIHCNKEQLKTLCRTVLGLLRCNKYFIINGIIVKYFLWRWACVWM